MQYVSSRLAQLSVAAAAGELGDTNHWLEAEKRWSVGVSIEDFLATGPMSLASGFQGELPVWPGIATRGIALSEFTGIGASGGPQEGSPQQLTEQMVSIYSRITRDAVKSWWADLLLFAAALFFLADKSDEIAEPEIPGNRLFGGVLSSVPLSTVLDLTSRSRDSWRCAALVNAAAPNALVDPTIRETFMGIGRSRGLSQLARGPARVFWDQWLQEDSAWPLGRLGLHLNPRMDPSELEFGPFQDDGGTSDLEKRFRLFVECIRLIARRQMSQHEAARIVSALSAPIAGGGERFREVALDSVNLILLSEYIETMPADCVNGWAIVAREALAEDFEIGRRMVVRIAHKLSAAKALNGELAG